ncbi:hypothetical protein WMY93_019188 [Mugilogobius chulae]|uniref:Ig-like domain-containing protein n=1 Tax=Mugilogobius chulae TaxID=88201 RepID=A0AAW0NDG6_9GOBI
MKAALLLLLFLTVSTGEAPEKVCVKSGEMVALECCGGSRGQKVTWSTPQDGEFDKQTNVLIIDGRLVLLNVSKDLQKKYYCSNG